MCVSSWLQLQNSTSTPLSHGNLPDKNIFERATKCQLCVLGRRRSVHPHIHIRSRAEPSSPEAVQRNEKHLISSMVLCDLSSLQAQTQSLCGCQVPSFGAARLRPLSRSCSDSTGAEASRRSQWRAAPAAPTRAGVESASASALGAGGRPGPGAWDPLSHPLPCPTPQHASASGEEKGRFATVTASWCLALGLVKRGQAKIF